MPCTSCVNATTLSATGSSSVTDCLCNPGFGVVGQLCSGTWRPPLSLSFVFFFFFIYFFHFLLCPHCFCLCQLARSVFTKIRLLTPIALSVPSTQPRPSLVQPTVCVHLAFNFPTAPALSVMRTRTRPPLPRLCARHVPTTPPPILFLVPAVSLRVCARPTFSQLTERARHALPTQGA